jgi:rhodanese-related sulfurtransferase
MQHNSRFLMLVEQAKNQVAPIEHRQLALLLNDPNLLLIDVREKEEFDRGHLPNAIHMSKGVLERDIEKIIPNPEANIVLYCSGGYRSVLAADNLQKMGYSKVKSLAGGSSHWQLQGLPWATS